MTKDKEEKERKAREKLLLKEAKEKEKAEAKIQKEREKAALLAAKEREKELKEQQKEREKAEKAERAGLKSGASSSSLSSVSSAASGSSSPPSSASALKPVAFSRKSVHMKKEPEKKSSAPSLGPIPKHANETPPVALESYQKAHMGMPMMRKEHHGSSRFRKNHGIPLEKLPTLQSCKALADRQELMLKKLKQCSNTYDFEDATSDVKSKEIKRLALEELLSFLKTDQSRGMLSEAGHEAFCRTFADNAFRMLSPPSVINGADFDPEEDEPVLERAWAHMQLIYEIFCAFLEHKEFQPSLAKVHIDTTFANRLLELFESEDPRERDMLKGILHRVYGKIIPLRGHIRRAMNNIFNRFVYEPPGKHNGIAELLEILGSVINGFALPLKDEHKVFLIKVLLPLHKAKALSLFHPQLSYCVVQFLEKDAMLTNSVVHYLLHIWPRTHSPKEVIFLNEMEEIVSTIPSSEFAKIHVVFFERLARCLRSQHFQVAERALYYFSNEIVLQAIKAYAPMAMPALLGGLSANARTHWNKNINALTFSALKTLLDLNPPLFEQCSLKAKSESAQAQSRIVERRARWQQLESMATRNPLSASMGAPAALPALQMPVAQAEGLEDTIAELQRLSVDPDPRGLKNARMRRKSFLPQDQDVQQALMAHTPHGVALGHTGD